jgi:hypothetical protein
MQSEREESGMMVWMPEIGLGIGCEFSIRGNWEREWVYWYDLNCVRYPTDDERFEQEKLSKLQAERQLQQSEALLKKYRDRFGDISE